MVKVYTVNGAAAGSASSLPDWLVRKRAAKAKGKRSIREHVEGAIELIQHFEFPEASIRIKTTRDGHHAIATGTYKPQMRVWDLDQLALKFERHADVENVDFVVSCFSPLPFSLYYSVPTIDIGRAVHRSFPTTGQRACICRRTAPSSCTLRAAFIIAHGYLASAGPSHTISPVAMRSSVHRATRYTV
jgi:hypothetical protein